MSYPTQEEMLQYQRERRAAARAKRRDDDKAKVTRMCMILGLDDLGDLKEALEAHERLERP